MNINTLIDFLNGRIQIVLRVHRIGRNPTLCTSIIVLFCPMTGRISE